jgi:hypothetical protein
MRINGDYFVGDLEMPLQFQPSAALNTATLPSSTSLKIT